MADGSKPMLRAYVELGERPQQRSLGVQRTICVAMAHWLVDQDELSVPVTVPMRDDDDQPISYEDRKNRYVQTLVDSYFTDVGDRREELQ